MSSKYETVIGLEVHVQLLTETKIFCGCSTRFGAEPNTQVCPVCLGLPGALPVLNKKAFEYAIKVAIALNCDTQKIVKFDRKNYYYPDLPKNYQISQYDMPIAYKGFIDIEEADGTLRKIGVTRAHLEEDAGKLIHDSSLPYSYVDLNRTGTPLLEIVSEPDLRTAEEAYQYLVTLKQIIEYLGVSDCNMEEGSLRCDANISIRKKGETLLGVKVEIKNLNSFKAVRDSLLFEEERQEDVIEDGGKIIQETRLWNVDKSVTESMRTKEGEQDYRFFPDPDLVPFEVEASTVERIKKTMPDELPAAKKARFVKEYKLNGANIKATTGTISMGDFFEEMIKAGSPPDAACNWIKGELMMYMNERGVKDPKELVPPKVLSGIASMVSDGKISRLVGKDVLKECIDTGKDAGSIVKEKGLEQVSDEGELEGIIDSVVSENEKSANDFKDGKENALSFLVGQVMKKTKGKANPKLAGEMLRKKLSV